MPARGKISAEQSHHDHGISDYIYVRMRACRLPLLANCPRFAINKRHDGSKILLRKLRFSCFCHSSPSLNPFSFRPLSGPLWLYFFGISAERRPVPISACHRWRTDRMRRWAFRCFGPRRSSGFTYTTLRLSACSRSSGSVTAHTRGNIGQCSAQLSSSSILIFRYRSASQSTRGTGHSTISFRKR